MKQSEQLDFILNQLYEVKNDGMYHNIPQIAWEIVDDGEDWQKMDQIRRLSKRLEEDGYIKATWMLYGPNAIITSRGIDYCERSSYSNRSMVVTEVVKNIHVSNSSNVNIVANSQDVKIQSNITNNDKPIEIIRLMLDELNKDNSISSEQRGEIIDLLKDIKEKLENNKPASKYFKTLLLDYGSKISSIGNFAINLCKLLPME